jgi:hypothetical protein
MGSKWILGRLAGGEEWIEVAQYTDRWRAVVNAVINLPVLLPWGYFISVHDQGLSSYSQNKGQGPEFFSLSCLCYLWKV